MLAYKSIYIITQNTLNIISITTTQFYSNLNFDPAKKLSTFDKIDRTRNRSDAYDKLL